MIGAINDPGREESEMTQRLLRQCSIIASLTVLFGALVLAADTKVAYAVDSMPNSSAADRLMSYVGRWGGDVCRDAGSSSAYGGQCKEAVRCALILASGGRVRTGGGYYSDYVRAGGQLVSATQAQKGDIVQLNGGNRDVFYRGMHTAIVTSPFRGEVVNVVDSNFYGDERVRQHDWNPFDQARRYGLTVHVWRMGTVASSPSYVRYAVATDSARLRSCPSFSCTVLQTVGRGTPVDVVCQTRGDYYAGGTLWSKLTGGQLVHDTLLTTPNFNALSAPYRWC